MADSHYFFDSPRHIHQHSKLLGVSIINSWGSSFPRHSFHYSGTAKSAQCDAGMSLLDFFFARDIASSARTNALLPKILYVNVIMDGPPALVSASIHPSHPAFTDHSNAVSWCRSSQPRSDATSPSSKGRPHPDQEDALSSHIFFFCHPCRRALCSGEGTERWPVHPERSNDGES